MVRGLAHIIAFWLVSAPSLAIAATTANADATLPTVNLGYAQYQGYFDPQVNVTNFLSIRYAAPPVGTSRFRGPQLPPPQPGIQLATQNPSPCNQGTYGAGLTAPVSPYGYNKRQSTVPTASEDCLFLNVFVPGQIPSKPVTMGGHPVVVWIHGGAYQIGYAELFNGADLVADSLNTAIVVVIQYRLGAFGFLSSNEVKSHGALNAGLLDQRMALEWVQDHIGIFGGDKNNVTIWGESAGAGSVIQHIVANGGNTQPPLFHAAITSSTFLPSQYDYNGRVPQLVYDELVNMTGCASSKDTFSCLQSIDVGTLQNANYELGLSFFYGTYAFIPVVDGTFIVERPTVTLSKGLVNGKLLLSIVNQNEGNPFVNTNVTTTITNYIAQLFPDMTALQVQQAADVYKSNGTEVEQAIMLIGDSVFVCPTYYLLQAFAGRSWKGLFGVPPGYHGNDLAYYFYSASTPPPYNNTQFIKAFSQSFMSVVKYHDVNIKFDPTNITPFWNKYYIGETEMVFNRTEGGAPMIQPTTTDPMLLQRCAFWETMTSSTSQ